MVGEMLALSQGREESGRVGFQDRAVASATREYITRLREKRRINENGF
jgi:hypothetical protein